MNTKRINIWLDCDPGHDDMMAIILSSLNPNINLIGISTSAGNSSI
jgi:uridine nucleosidase